MGEFPRSEKHTLMRAWNRAYEKFIDETVNKIGQQYFCRRMKLGRVYLVCLHEAGYLDHVFPLPENDPQHRTPGTYDENWAGTLDKQEEAGAMGE